MKLAERYLQFFIIIIRSFVAFRVSSEWFFRIGDGRRKKEREKERKEEREGKKAERRVTRSVSE